MFGKRIDLFRLFGFEIRIDLSWVIIAIFVAWSLSVGLFPFRYEGLTIQTYWIMGIVGAIGFFISIIVHEMSHSIVAKHYGTPIKGITLFIFGGVAEMKKEPSSPKAEFMLAVAGPLASLIIAVVFYEISVIGRSLGWSEPVYGVIKYLSWINGILAVFNLLPAFPLDGGRILRSVLWGIKKDLRWATRIAAGIGSGFGMLISFLGILQFLQGNFIGGMWLFFIGMFIRSAASTSYSQLLVRQSLQGEPVKRFMNREPVTVPPSITLKELVENFIYRYQYKLFPIVGEGDILQGCVTLKRLKEVPQEDWDRRKVEDIIIPCSPDNTIDLEADAVDALSLMNREGSSRLMVTQRNRLVGIISLKDMLKFLEVKVELEP